MGVGGQCHAPYVKSLQVHLECSINPYPANVENMVSS